MWFTDCKDFRNCKLDLRKWESGIWEIFPSLVQSVFAENVVAVIFVISIILSLVLPENMEIKKMGE
ncbi:hypothetical protein DWZ38_08870 [Ruminococcus sp. AF31-8BH]|nr:hypothetical protein DWZ38_08870 [Ruminococcus sp. AF31-8BH]